MGIRFRRSMKILPGVRLNLSRRGVGVSAGVKGAHVSTGPSGSRVTGSLPGTGLYYQKSIGKKHSKASGVGEDAVQSPPVIRGRYYLKPWRAVLGILMGFIGFGVLFSGIDDWSLLFPIAIFLAIAVLLLFPWALLLFDILKNLINRKNDLPE